MKSYLTILILLATIVSGKDYMDLYDYHKGKRCNHDNKFQHTKHNHNKEYGTTTRYTSIKDDGKGNKTIYNIKNKTKKHGKSTTQVIRDVTDECISSMADVNSLQATYTKQTEFAKGINDETGDPMKKAWISKYEATIKVFYMVRETEMMVIITESVGEAVPPKFKELDKKITNKKVFKSHSSNGDSFAGRSKRFYFHSTKESALKDVQAQAKAWVTHQSPLYCDDVLEVTGK